MSDQQKSPFARLDTSLLRSTAMHTSENTTPATAPAKQENKETSFQENVETRKLENKETRKQENLETRKQENKETRKQVSKETSKRVLYPKVTYQLDPEVTELLEDTKKTLKRKYGLKVGLAEIVEEGIRAICDDVTQNKETSKLVSLFSSKQENKET